MRTMLSEDFRQLRRQLLCWRAADLEKNGTPGLEEGWRITGDGLEYATMQGYQVIIDGVTLGAGHGNFRRVILALLETRKVCQQQEENDSMTRRQLECDLAPVLVKFLRPEVAILGADLREYGPFRVGEVAAVPFVHAAILVQNGAAERID